MANRTLASKRFLIHGLNTLVLTIAVIGALVVGYVLVDRYRPFRVDLTEQGIHSLAPKTKEILGRLDREIEVTFFGLPQGGSVDPSFVNKKVEDLLEEFKVRSKGKIKYSMRSIYTDELLLTELGADPGCAVFQAGDARIVVQAKDIFETQWGGFGGEAPSTKFTGEEAFDQAILQLMEGKSRMACFLTGHGEAAIEARDETGFAVAKELLRRENFDAREVTISAASGSKLDAPLKLDAATPAAALSEVPNDCTVLVIAGPRSPISGGEADAIVRFWENGRGVVLFAEPLTDSGVGALSQRFGVEMLPGVAADPEGQTQSPLAMVVQYGRHPIVDDLAGAEIPAVLIKAGGFRGGEGATPILMTTESGMQLTDIANGAADPRSDKNIKGPINLGYAVEKQLSPEKTARAVIIGDVDFARNRAIAEMAQGGAPGNIDLLKNAVHWSAGAVEKIGIGPKDPSFNPITITGRSMFLVWLMTAFVLPVAIFGSGISVWMRRRRR